MNKYWTLIYLVACLGASANAGADTSDVEFKVNNSQFSVYAGNQGVGFHFYFDESNISSSAVNNAVEQNTAQRMNTSNAYSISKLTKNTYTD